MSDQKNNNSRKKENQKNKNPLSEYAKYSTIGFQMLVIILIGVFGGMKLDEIITGLEFPLFTLLLSVIAIGLSIYYAIKDFINFK
jgi:hypothetical protein